MSVSDPKHLLFSYYRSSLLHSYMQMQTLSPLSVSYHLFFSYYPHLYLPFLSDIANPLYLNLICTCKHHYLSIYQSHTITSLSISHFTCFLAITFIFTFFFFDTANHLYFIRICTCKHHYLSIYASLHLFLQLLPSSLPSRHILANLDRVVPSFLALFALLHGLLRGLAKRCIQSEA